VKLFKKLLTMLLVLVLVLHINPINAKAENDTIEQIINVTNFAKGVYYIRIINDKFNKTQKLIVK